MGKETFASIRNTYKLLASGRILTKHNYTFRINASKLVLLIHNLQGKLQPKAGRLLNVTIANHNFKLSLCTSALERR